MPKIPIERLDSDLWAPPWTKREHLARYLFASQFVPDKVVADCACGDGTSSEIFGAKAAAVFGFDLSQEAIERAKVRKTLAPSVTLQCASATELPLDRQSVDVFVSLETIEHIDDDRAFLDEVVRVLREDGTFVCSTPDRDVHSPGNTAMDPPWTPYHIKEYTAEEFAKLLGDHFASVNMYGQNPSRVWATRFRCWVGRKISKKLVLRLTHLMKLTWLLGLRSSRHDVVPVSDRRMYEYLVAVCSGVIRAGP